VRERFPWTSETAWANPRVGVPGYRNIAPPAWDPAQPVDPAAAEEFLQTFYGEVGPRERLLPRLREVNGELARTGTYTHTPEELEFGARVAWRNSSRCIGRLYWRTLRVRDRRGVRRADEIFAELVAHLIEATNDGKIRPTITVFAAATPGRPFAKVWNEQLIRYAGYRQLDGSCRGDRQYAQFTAAVHRMGWRGDGGRFDILPLVIETPDERPRLYELPEEAVLEVPVHHPDLPWLAELGLRWHAVPTISNMRLEIGGVHYPFSPFNGWYMGTEIGARNLADADRYDMLPAIARRLHLDTSSERTLWRDRALVELNRAVLHSYVSAGVRITDHHTESLRFLKHIEAEERQGRVVPADWTWIVPPMSSGITPVFRRYYAEVDLTPNFYNDPTARRIARQGGKQSSA
jgi:nitric-oxide synthase, bacterial